MTDQIATFPIIISKNDTDDDFPYLVKIPDLDGVTEGESITNAIEMAKDYIGTYSLENELPKSNTVLPKFNVTNSTATLVTVNVSEYKRKNAAIPLN